MGTVTVNRELGWLAAHQERILGIVDGLSQEQMRTTVLPSGWTPVGMAFPNLQHKAALTVLGAAPGPAAGAKLTARKAVGML